MLDIFKSAFELTKKNALVLIGIIITVIIISMVFSFITGLVSSIPVVGFVVNLISIIFQLYFGVGLIKLGLAIVDGKEPEFSDIKPTWNEMVKYLISGLMLMVVFLVVFMITIGLLGMLDVIKPGLSILYKDILMGADTTNYTKEEITYAIMVFFLLTIPAILIYLRLQFSNYLIIDRKIEVGNAIIHSFRMTKGYLWLIVITLIGVIILNILGLIMLFIGLLFTIPMSFLVIMILYRTLDQNYQETLNTDIKQE